MSRSFLSANVDELVSKLTAEEKISLLSAPNWWNTTSIGRLEIPAVRMSDGPNVREHPWLSVTSEVNLSTHPRVFEAPRISFQHQPNVYL